MIPEIKRAVEFTRVHQAAAGKPAPVREAECLAAQYPAILRELREDDVLAGFRKNNEIVFFGTIRWFPYPQWTPERQTAGKQGGYCFDFSAKHRLYAESDENEKKQLDELTAYWRRESTISKFFDGGPEHEKLFSPHSPVEGAAIGFCMAHDLDKLVRLGLSGLRRELADRAELAERKKDSEAGMYCCAATSALDTVSRTFLWYARQAARLSKRRWPRAGYFKRMSEDLEFLAGNPPETFAQAVQLVWLYNLLPSGKHIEWNALDVALGDLYVKSVDSGEITEEECMDILCGLWRLINANGEDAVCRITLGGKGRRNPENADRFAMAAMEATRRVRLVTPQLTLRLYEGMNPALLNRAYKVIGEGCVYPMLYNDEAIIPGVMKSMHLDAREACGYFPLGCGEYMLAHDSPSMLDINLNVPKILEAALHNGRDRTGARIGPETGDPTGFETFDNLFSAFLEQVQSAARNGAHRYLAVRNILSGTAPFLLSSVLSADCIERGRGLFNGGLRKVGACLMGHGYTNASDALSAIKLEVFQKRSCSLKDVTEAVDSNFERDPDLRKRLLNAPKFGNDDTEADGVFMKMWENMNRIVDSAGRAAGFDFFTISSVNPGGYGMGAGYGATPDGRLAHEPFAIGNSPMPGRDKRGITALCNSISKVSAVNGGATTNFKLSRELFKGDMPAVKAIFGVFFRNGGQQASISVVNQEDLTAALKEPDKYSHIIVRVGGWCARFIDLEPDIQSDIIKRTFYA